MGRTTLESMEMNNVSIGLKLVRHRVCFLRNADTISLKVSIHSRHIHHSAAPIAPLMYMTVGLHPESLNSKRYAFYAYWHLASALHIRGTGSVFWADQEDDKDDDDRDG